MGGWTDRNVGILLSISGAILTAINVSAESNIPSNIDGGLRRLLQEEQTSQGFSHGRRGRGGLAIRDAEQRVRVDIYLDGKVSIAEVRQQILAANGRVTAETDTYRNGVLTAYLPLEQVPKLAKAPGVLSIKLSRRPIRNADEFAH
jgi:hypothetical protein